MAILDYEYDPKALQPETKRGVDFMYEAADRKAAHDAWVDCFTKNGKLHKGELSPVGPEELKKYIVDSWNNTVSRVHDVKKVDVIQSSPLVLKIEGVTTYQRSNGQEQQGSWTAKQTYAEENGIQRVCDYKINFVSIHKTLQKKSI
ncbi:unnamed protein product [Clonostachys rhizophaga]|uniref:SnoaL-like domain-containing protein n=1 Tax=Clonostachys rhizophaga TaxID=160324 RepID=A0A9N9VBD4_9HYPO|nr:unnamed protein product [Clonostachys rhizophaga]